MILLSNLSELNPQITSESIVPRLRQAFEEVYSGRSECLEYSEIIKKPEVRALYEEFASDEWRYGKWRTFTAQRSGQFDWGGVEVGLEIVDGIIKEVQIASDALDLEAINAARAALVGTSATVPPAPSPNPIVRDILSILF